MTPGTIVGAVVVSILFLAFWALTAYMGRESLVDHWDRFPTFFQVVRFTVLVTLIAAAISLCLWCGSMAMEPEQYELAWWQVPFAIVGCIAIVLTVLCLGYPALCAMQGCFVLAASWTLLLFYPVAKRYRGQLGFC